MNENSNKKPEPAQLEPRQLGLVILWFGVVFFAKVVTITVLKKLGWEPFAGGTGTLGLMLFLVMAVILAIQGRIRNFRALLSWTMAVLLGTIFGTIFVGLVVSLLSKWIGSGTGANFVVDLASIFAAMPVWIGVFVVANRSMDSQGWAPSLPPGADSE